MLDNPDGYINLLDDCPVCNGIIEPHCNVPACDIVRCQRCLNIGSIDGRYWPKPRFRVIKPSGEPRIDGFIATVLIVNEITRENDE